MTYGHLLNWKQDTDAEMRVDTEKYVLRVWTPFGKVWFGSISERLSPKPRQTFRRLAKVTASTAREAQRKIEHTYEGLRKKDEGEEL